MNMGVAASTADYIVFTDGDCLPHRDFVADHQNLAEPGFWVQGKRAQIRESFTAQAQAVDARGLHLLRRGWVWRAAYGLRWPIPIVWKQTGAFRERALGSNMAMWRSDLEAVKRMVEAGLGVAIMATWTVRDELARGSLIARPVGPRGLHRNWGIIHRANDALTASQRGFLSICRTRFPELVSDGKAS